MNKNVEQKLSVLGGRKVRPEVLADMRKRIFDTDGRPLTPSPFTTPQTAPVRSPFYVGGITVGMLAIVLVFLSSNSLQSDYMLTKGELALNRRADIRSEIALTYLDSVTKRAQQDGMTADEARYLQNAIALSADELDRLKLMGEPGRYTMQECKDLYTRFDSQLDSIKVKLATETETPALVSTIDRNLAHVKERIALYPEKAGL